MTATPTLPSPPDDHRALRALQIAQLGALAAMGLRLAGAIERQATDPVEGEARLEAESAGRAFGRAARAVRLAILLQTRLMDAPQPGAYSLAADPEVERRKADVQRIVGRVIAREVDWNRIGARNDLAQQTAERLDRDFGGDLLARPVSELIDLICTDLGLDPQWPRLAQEAWALDEIDRGQSGRPLAAYVQVEDATRPKPRPAGKPPDQVDRLSPSLIAE